MRHACCLFHLKRHKGDGCEGRTANLEGKLKEAQYFWRYPTSRQSSTSAITFPMRLMTSFKYALTLEGLCSVTGLWNRLLLQANIKPLLRWNSIYSWNVVLWELRTRLGEPGRPYNLTFLGWRQVVDVCNSCTNQVYCWLDFSLSSCHPVSHLPF